MYVCVIIRQPDGSKRIEYATTERALALVQVALGTRSVRSITVRPVTEAEYVRHTVSE